MGNPLGMCWEKRTSGKNAFFSLSVKKILKLQKVERIVQRPYMLVTSLTCHPHGVLPICGVSRCVPVPGRPCGPLSQNLPSVKPMPLPSDSDSRSLVGTQSPSSQPGQALTEKPATGTQVLLY